MSPYDIKMIFNINLFEIIPFLELKMYFIKEKCP